MLEPTRTAKKEYRLKTEGNFNSNNTSRMWQDLQSIIDYKTNVTLPSNADPLLAEDLNLFFSHFENALDMQMDWYHTRS